MLLCLVVKINLQVLVCGHQYYEYESLHDVTPHIQMVCPIIEKIEKHHHSSSALCFVSKYDFI